MIMIKVIIKIMIIIRGVQGPDRPAPDYDHDLDHDLDHDKQHLLDWHLRGKTSFGKTTFFG